MVNVGGDRERRFSMPYFVHPRPDVDLSPLPSCVARTGGAARYASLSAGHLLDRRLRELGLGVEVTAR